MAKKTFNIGIAGLGTVGSSVVNILKNNLSPITKNEKFEFKITKASVRNLDSIRNCDTSNIELTINPLNISSDPNIDIVIEVMGSIEQSLLLAKQTLSNHKPFVTANKALLALHGKELFSLASKNNVPILFEAAVATATPIIKVLRESMPANNISQICGIINGTSNYLLTKMADEGISYQDILKEAQKLGYAEADPTFDVEGIDAAHKICLLAELIFQQNICFDEIYHQGLSHIQLQDFTFAKRLGYSIKPLAVASQDKKSKEISIHVNPVLIAKSSLIANVNGVLNTIQISTDHAGEVTLTATGGGGNPTASSVIADITEVAKALNANTVIEPFMPFTESAKIKPFGQTEHSFYIRLQADDKPGMLQQCTQILSRSNISVEAVLQDEPNTENQPKATIAIITNKVQEVIMQVALNEITNSNGFNKDKTLIRLFKN